MRGQLHTATPLSLTLTIYLTLILYPPITLKFKIIYTLQEVAKDQDYGWVPATHVTHV